MRGVVGALVLSLDRPLVLRSIPFLGRDAGLPSHSSSCAFSDTSLDCMPTIVAETLAGIRRGPVKPGGKGPTAGPLYHA